MIKKLLQFSLGNKFALFLMVIIIVLGGVYASAKIKLELLPDAEPPIITVQTAMPGATPETIKKEISDKVDKQVRSMENVKNVSAEAIQNTSMVSVEYEVGTDMSKAENELQKEIEKIKFKDNVKDTELTRSSIDTFPIVAYSFTTKDKNLKAATSQIERHLIPKLQKIDGVQNAQINGQTSREVTIKFDKERLSKNGLTEEDVEEYIKNATSETPLGLFQFDTTEKSIVIDGKFESVKALRQLDIPLSASSQSNTSSTQQGKEGTVKLESLASVSLGDQRKSISKTNGKDAVNVQITKSQDANTVQVADNVKKEIDKFKTDYPKMESNIVMDTAKPIKESVFTMIEKGVFGTIVAIIVILLFLRNIKMTTISIVSIPLSILIAMIALIFCNISLNILTLGALTIAIGRVIDDSIVVVENIYRRLSRNDETIAGEGLIISATKQVFKPILSSTIVTIIVFLPLGFVTGTVGEMFRPFALAISFSLLASLLVSITIVPALASTYFKKGISTTGKSSLGAVSTYYKKVLHWSLNHKWIVMIVSTALLAISIVLGSVQLGTSFIATGDNKYMALTYTPKPGETEQSVLNHATEAQKYLNRDDQVKTVQYSVGGTSPLSQSGNNNSMAMMVQYDSDTPNFEKIPDKVLKHFGTFKHPGEWSNQDMGTGSNNKIEITVTGPSIHKISNTVTALENKMHNTDSVVNVKSDLSQTYDQYDINVDQNAATEHGITASQLAAVLNENEPDDTLTIVKDNGKAIDVKVKQDKQTNWSQSKLENTEIPSATGSPVRLSDIATLKQSTTPNKIKTEEGDYTATISGKVIDGDVGGISKKLSNIVDDMDTPNNVDAYVGGAKEDIEDAIVQLSLAMIAAIIIVYLVLVLTFKGALAPFTILFSLPYTIIGVVFALLITRETISVPSMIGMLMLIGIVVTNAIVLIDRVIDNQSSGMDMHSALLEAAGTRIRPILMTALATIGALIPMLFGEDGSMLISKGMAATVIGGLISSTLLTLIVVPVIYDVLFTFKAKVLQRFNKQ